MEEAPGGSSIQAGPEGREGKQHELGENGSQHYPVGVFTHSTRIGKKDSDPTSPHPPWDRWSNIEANSEGLGGGECKR